MLSFRNDFALYYDFYMVAKTGSFSRTAEENYISQPTLSRNIKKLEEILNTQLLNRLVSGISLTKEGKDLYKVLYDMFSSIENSPIIKSESELNGKIVIGTTENIMNIYLSEVLPNFIKEYPSIGIEIITADSNNLYKKMCTHEIDILFDYLPFNDSYNFDYEVKPVKTLKTCFACSKNYFNSNKDNLTDTEKMKECTFIIPGKSRRRQLLDEFFREHNIRLNPLIELPNSYLMKVFVKEDIGIGYFLKDDIEEELKDKFKEVNFGNHLPENTIGMIYPKKYRTACENIFIQSLANEKI